MARSYITEKQVGREFWFFAIKHAAHMLNQVPGRLGRKLTSPFELVYNQKPDARTWFELFSVGYFPVESKSGESASTFQSQSMDGIAVGRCDKSNTIMFYNPITRKYYSPPVFKLERSHLPVMLYPKNIRFDGGFVCGPLRNRTDPVAEPFPPGTRVLVDVKGTAKKGTIQNVPLPFHADLSIADPDLILDCALFGCVIAEEKTAEAVTASILVAFRESGKLLEKWRLVTSELYPDRSDLLDQIPRAGELTLSKLAKEGFTMTDTCSTTQKIQRLISEAIDDIASKEGLSPDEIKVRQSHCWQHLRNVWFGGVSKVLNASLVNRLSDCLESLPSILRIDMNVEDLYRCVEKEFGQTANYVKGQGGAIAANPFGLVLNRPT